MVQLRSCDYLIPIDTFPLLEEVEKSVEKSEKLRQEFITRFQEIDGPDGYSIVKECWDSIFSAKIKEFITPYRNSYESSVKFTLDGHLVLENLEIYAVCQKGLERNTILREKIPCQLTRESFILMASEMCFRE
ncbi:DgyrCDS9379 [Dimorphilus gyrociliatus]|uniref:DgyrCDS9379 n=1 Tax=Dimorphilus gyrociliatus TaxID=2664684 RepID=A0A7I8VZH1_9ANNE|nr:DgyrCDS9379 [Dimorphilus gyrociliatus]